jgi:Na+/proline symporter
MRDFIERFGWVTDQSSKRYVRTARATTFAWGMICCLFAFVVGDISPTVVEAINKVGSLTYGPVLAVFVIAFGTRWVDASSTIVGLVVGVLSNIALWIWVPSIAWPWWNVTGFAVAAAIAALLSWPRLKAGQRVDLDLVARDPSDADGKDGQRYAILALAGLAIALISWGMGRLLAR